MCGVSVPLLPTPSVGRVQPKPTASCEHPPLSDRLGGIYFVLNLKNLARYCYVTNPLLKSHLGKRASCFLVNPTITSRNSSQRNPATLAGFLPGWLLELKTYTHPAHAFCFYQFSGLMFGFQWDFNKEVK